ncbi:MAG: U32 family peptidase, partial [Deltaproteobacteria bacterium]
MKIVAPVSSVQEVEMLLHFGADELYCGISTPEWEEHFGGHWWINRRSPRGANLVSREGIQEVVGLAHQRDVPVHVTLNAPFYTQGSIRYVLRLAEKLVSELAIDSIIASDLNFLMLLSRERLPVKIHLSSLGSCFNSRSVDFYSSLGIDRIILPRQLRLSEINQIVTGNNSQIEFEIFAVND